MNVACPQLDHEEDQIAFQSLQREDLDREQIGCGQPVGGELLLSPQSVEIIKFGDPGSGR